jgi:hypothetical protein
MGRHYGLQNHVIPDFFCAIRDKKKEDSFSQTKTNEASNKTLQKWNV